MGYTILAPKEATLFSILSLMLICFKVLLFFFFLQ